MKTAWQAILALGAALTVAQGCKVSVESDDDGTGFEEGGRSGTAGGKTSSGGRVSAEGGESSGGARASGGRSASGGAKASGGDTTSAGEPPYDCSNPTVEMTPTDTCEFPAENLSDERDGPCFKCLQDTPDCCSAVKECFGSPTDACAIGFDGRTEFMCYQNCIYTRAVANGGFYKDSDPDECASNCATCSGIPSDAGNDVITCMHMNCEEACFVPK